MGFLNRFSRVERKGMCRPPFRPKQENFKMVEILVFAGWHQARIAQVIGIDPSTFAINSIMAPFGATMS
jgi:hypothetical protein